MIATLMKETRPFAFFTLISAALMSGSFIFAAPVLVEYFQTGLVERMPTWVLAMTMMLGSLMVFMAGVMLDSVARGRAEQKRIHYLSIAPSRGEQHISDSIRLRERRGAVLEDGSVKERGAWSVQVGGNKGRRS